MIEKSTLTINEAAKHSGIGQQELRWQAKNNPKFPCFVVGKRKILIERNLFEAWITERATKRVGLSK